MNDGTMGEIRMFAGDFPPKNWLFCNGALLGISQNQALFSILGTTYGGNGINTFALPDLRGRTPVGYGQGANLPAVQLGETAGTEANILNSTQLPLHNHMASCNNAGTGRSLQATPGGNYPAQNQDASANYSSSPNATMNAGTITQAGGSTPVNNMQPSLAMNYIICIYGYYPSRS